MGDNNSKLVFRTRQKLDYSAILSILIKFNYQFTPPTEEECDLQQYARKISKNAYLEICYDGDSVIGYLAYYENLIEHFIFVTSYVVDKDYRNQGIAQKLFNNLLLSCEKEVKEVRLAVEKTNDTAMAYYLKMGFNRDETKENQTKDSKFFLIRTINRR